ncbi:MAG: tetratricopeptide repeat protein [Bacteroidales bacterium]
MKQIKNILLILVVLVSSNITVNANNNIMINAYSQALIENPKDVESLLGRAKEYNSRNEFNKALDDLNSVIKYTESNKKEMLREVYMLRANVNDSLEKYEDALSDVNMVLDGYSDVYALTFRADLCLKLDMLDQAKTDYQTLLNVSTRNYVAMYGLAQVAVKQENNGIAKDYVNRAVELYPRSPDVYLNRADIMAQLNEQSQSAHDLIMAMSFNYDNPRAVRALLEMSRTNYKVVVSSLNDAIKISKDDLTLYYVRAFIKMSSTDYAGALDDMEMVTSKIEDKYSDGVNNDLALISYKLGKFADALNYADMAIRLNPNKVNYYTLKAAINIELGKYDAALVDLKNAMLIDPINSEALLLQSRIKMEDDEYNEAILCMNEAIMNNPEIAENIILRGLIKANFLNDDKAADNDLNMVLMLDDIGLDSYRGFALAFLDRGEEAESWIEAQLIDPLDIREANYRAAVLYSILGEVDKALAAVEVALINGYGDYYNLMINDYGFLNTLLLHKLPQYKALVDKYLGAK